MASSNTFFITLVSMFMASSAKTCSNHQFSQKRTFKSCVDLPYLQAHLHWNYIPSAGKLQIGFRAAHNSSGWIAWGINQNQNGMVGSQAIVAFRNSKGSMTVYATPITSYQPPMKPGKLRYQVSDLSAEYANNEMAMFAVFQPLYNLTSIYHVWQSGYFVLYDHPMMHYLSDENLSSMGKLDLV